MLHFCLVIFVFIVSLGTLIIVHELGHFLVARSYGVTVERFSIGLGPVLWCWRDKYGTQFVISAILLGGYVKMLEKHVNIVPSKYLDNKFDETFNHKTISQRAIIITAGPAFNFIFTIIAYWIVLMIGIPSCRPIISSITPNSIVAQADISPIIAIKSVDNIEKPDWNSVRLPLLDKIGNNAIRIDVAKLGSMFFDRKTVDLHDLNLNAKYEDKDILLALGIIPCDLRIKPIIAQVQIGTAADKAGLQAGDKIVQVDGQWIREWEWFVMKVRDNPGRKLAVIIERQGSAMEIALIPDSKLVDQNQVKGFAGIIPQAINLSPKYQTILKLGPLPAFTQAVKNTWQLIRLTASIFSKLINGEIKLYTLRGPIAIAQNASKSAEYGLIYYIIFLALLSVNIGIMNLFPLPILDGGHLLLLVIEKLKGSPVSPIVQEFSYRISTILLVLLMGIAFFNDISRL
ncbi:sigma E protease regulator RseP [Candidatus Palibaumannia cicadellinicola]|uniref:Zinc metalloprotease n=1 Tax=Candidatus Palibaumannia cicadellinicola TaxID=186490 RepID=A0A088MYL2_9GAMM|nr:sigma E protease regulator RseP [Candidatus Baumannia cicadellinicola]AIN47455.1 Membrane-associated zinc metalloprotease [Candidatus Baumannia cicadellinicola]